MKKNGKKWRKLQKEKVKRKATMMVGEPYSRASKKIKVCTHYFGQPGSIVAGYCVSLLKKINEEECLCKCCGKRFPIEMYDKMEKLTEYLSNKGCCTYVDYIAELSEGLEPVWYRQLSETEIEVVDRKENAEA